MFHESNYGALAGRTAAWNPARSVSAAARNIKRSPQPEVAKRKRDSAQPNLTEPVPSMRKWSAPELRKSTSNRTKGDSNEYFETESQSDSCGHGF